MSRNRQIRAPNSPQESIQSAIQHVTGSQSGHYGYVAGADGTGEPEAAAVVRCEDEWEALTWKWEAASWSLMPGEISCTYMREVCINLIVINGNEIPSAPGEQSPN